MYFEFLMLSFAFHAKKKKKKKEGKRNPVHLLPSFSFS